MFVGRLRATLSNLSGFARLSACAALALVSLPLFAGWGGRGDGPWRIFASWSLMQFNTALGILVVALALGSMVLRRHGLARALGLAVVLLGALTLGEYLFALNLGIDELFHKALSAGYAKHPGRMAPNTATSFLIQGVALLLLNRRRRLAEGAFIGGLLSTMPIALGMITVASYWIHISASYGWGNYALMSLPTAAASILSGLLLLDHALSLLKGDPRREINRPPLVLTLGLVLLSITLWQFFLALDAGKLRQVTEIQSLAARDQVLEKLTQYSLALRRMATRLEYLGTGDKGLIAIDSKSYIEQLTGLVRIGLVDPGHRVYWSYPSELHGQVTGFDQSQDSVRFEAFDAARRRGGAVLSRSVELRSGGRGFLLTVALSPKGRFSGYLYASINADTLFKETLRGFADHEVTVGDSGGPLFSNGVPGVEDSANWESRIQIDWGRTGWVLRLVPTIETLRRNQSPIHLVVLGTGLLFSLLMGLLYRFQLVAKGQQQELLERENRFRLLVDGVKDYGLFMLDPAGRVVSWNDGARRIKGYEAAEIIGRHFSVFYPEEDIESGKPAWELEIARDSGRYEEEGWRLRKDRSRFWANVVVTRITGVDGKLVGFAKVTRDLTESRAAADALRATAHKLKTLIDSSPIAILSLDRKLKISVWNPSCERLFGWTEKESLGRFLPFVPPDKIAEALGLIERIHNSKESVHFTADRSRKDGTPIKVETAAVPIFDEKGELDGLIALITDITEKHQLQQNLLAERERAVAASRVKSEFLANMSHEIRTPINGVLGMTNVLLESKLNDEQRDCAETIKSSGEALLTVINDILDFSKVEAGKMELEAIEFDLGDLVAETVKTLRYAATQKKLDFHVEGELDWSYHHVGDPGRIRQVLTNLLSNAIKFTPRGYVQVRVGAVSDDGPVDRMRFEVEDQGIGMSREALGRLFQAFSQAESGTARRFGGTGLGLSICRRLVQLMGGVIDVKSEEGKGSLFWFEIPLKRGSAIVAGHGSDARLEPKLSARSQAARVLLAEDNVINQKVALLHLKLLGVRADVVANGNEVLDALRRIPYDLILMDCQMPELDGYETTRRIRAAVDERFHDIPIVAMTANAVSGDRALCLAAGMNGYLAKPATLHALAEALEAQLASSSAPLSSNVAVLPRPAAEPEAVTLDAAILDDLSQLDAGSDDGIVRELSDLFIGGVPERLAALRAFLEAKEHAKITKAAHSLKASGGNIGARRFAGLCEELEDFKDWDVPGRARALLDGLDAEYAAVRGALNARLRRAA